MPPPPIAASGDELALGAAGLADRDVARCRRRRGWCGPACRRSRRRATGMRSDASCSRTAASLRWPIVQRRAATANMLAPPTSTASSAGARAPSAHEPVEQRRHRACRRTCRGAARRPPATRAARRGPARPRRGGGRRSARPMHEPRPSDDEHIAAARGDGELAHADHGLRSRSSPRGRAAPSSSSTPPWSGRAGSDTEQSSPSTTQLGVQQQRDVAAVGRAGEHAWRRSRRACRSAVAGGVGSISRPVIAASALM